MRPLNSSLDLSNLEFDDGCQMMAFEMLPDEVDHFDHMHEQPQPPQQILKADPPNLFASPTDPPNLLASPADPPNLLASPAAIFASIHEDVRQRRELVVRSLCAEGTPCALMLVQDSLGFPKKQKEPFSVTCALIVNPQLAQSAPVRVVSVATMELVVPAQLKKIQDSLKFNTANYDASTGLAAFDHLVCHSGSRLKLLRVRASLDVQVGDQPPVKIWSPPSKPTIVLTNEKQWATALQRLIGSKLFATTAQVEWSSIAAELQHCWLEGTRQSLQVPERPLRAEDIQTIKSMFLPHSTTMSKGAFEPFFEWFSILLSRLRFGNGVASFWTGGTILGFVPKSAVGKFLAGNSSGTGLLRFSRSAPDRLSLTYLLGADIRHYLIPQKTCASATGLANFFYQNSQVTSLIVDVSPPEYLGGRQVHLATPKSVFGAPKNLEAEIPGYDSSLFNT